MHYVYGLLLFLLIALEATVVQVPLTLIALLLFFVSTKSPRIYLYAFLLGIVLDILLVRRVGGSSIFFILFLFLVSLYDKKYEINTGFFVLVAGFVGSLLFGFVFDYTSPWLQAVLAALVAAIGFISIQIFLKPQGFKHV